MTVLPMCAHQCSHCMGCLGLSDVLKAFVPAESDDTLLEYFLEMAKSLRQGAFVPPINSLQQPFAFLVSMVSSSGSEAVHAAPLVSARTMAALGGLQQSES